MAQVDGDVLRSRLTLYRKVADAAMAIGGAWGSYRQLRSELRILPALPVRELRAAADDLARQYRQLDIEIQRANWLVDLAD